MTLSEALLADRLSQPFRYYDSVDSTNEIAMAWLQEGAASGSVVIADEQHKGRGRKGRTWYTPPGVALAVSVILRPPPNYVERISMVGAMAVFGLCISCELSNVGIKWPNDVQIGGRKVSGILPEALWENGEIQGVALGMGVNVRVQFDAELAQTATSIEAELGRSVDRIDLVMTLLERVDFWMTRISSDELFQIWKSRLITLGQRVQIDNIVGIAHDVEPSGTLLVATADGSIRRVMAGDVTLLAPYEEG